ncbi:DUF4928 family protein [Paenibacillus sp. CAU 1782]
MHEALEQKSMDILKQWYENEEPERYVVCAGLAVLEIARDAFPLQQSDYITAKNQVKTSGALIKKILERYGETRKYAAEGGRTTRGTRTAAEKFVAKLNVEFSELQELDDAQKHLIIDQMQGWLVDRVKGYFNRKRIEVELLLIKPSYQIISDILAAAEERKLTGAVAQHLVGAKLSNRFPDLEVENHSYTTADQQLGRPGDFLINDTVFHVTVAPMPAVIGKCENNIRQGYRAILLVPESKTMAAKQMAETLNVTQIGIFSIETFVGQNIEEISQFRKNELTQGFLNLLRKYNERVAAVETDLSMQIEIPENL